jgi:hypothetical protein
MLVVLKTYQICQNGPPLSYQLTDFGRMGECGVGVGVKLLI